jgi:hypothetical protein
MKIREAIDNVLEVLGMIGFTVRSDRKKGAWKSLDDRVWGVPAEKFSLSIQARPNVTRLNEQLRLIVALRNDTGADVRLTISTWLNYFDYTIRDPEGVVLKPNDYGRKLLQSRLATTMVAIPPTEPVQNEIPVSDMYSLNQPGDYHAVVSCQVPGAASGIRCVSNEVVIRVSA